MDHPRRRSLDAPVLLCALVLHACGGCGSPRRSPAPGGAVPLPEAPSCTVAAGGGSATVAEPTLLFALSDDDESAWLGSPAVADLDGDGHAEIIITHNGNLVVWNDDGTPKWRFDEAQEIGRIWASPIVADFRDDAALEIVFAARDTVFMLDASGALIPGFPVDWQDELRGLAAGDVDGDGQLDIIGAATDNDPDILMAWHANGVRVSGFPPVGEDTIGCEEGGNCWIAGAFDQNLAVGDLDGDGHQDIVAPMDNAYIAVHHGTGEAFDAAAEYRNRPKTPGVRFLLELEEAHQGFTETESTSLQAYFKNSPPAIADLDGDGAYEIVVLGSVGNASLSERELGTALFVLGHDLSRRPGWAYPFTSPDYLSGFDDLGGNIVGATNQVSIADLDAGHPGLEMVFAGLDGRIHAVHADNTEMFDVRYTDDPHVLTGGVVIGDLSGDGIPEIVFNTYTTDVGDGDLFVLDAGGNTLHTIPLPGLGAMPVPTLADVDGNGSIEIVVSLRSLEWGEPCALVYTVPSSSDNCLPWPTGRANLLRNGWITRP